jgi:hypothetical protein
MVLLVYLQSFAKIYRIIFLLTVQFSIYIVLYVITN